MAGWRTEPQKTRGKIANRAARVFLATSCQAALHGVHSSVRFHFSEIQSYYSLFLQVPTFTSHLPTNKECTPVRFWFAVYSRSAGFIRALFARLRVFSVNSAQTMPSQRIFSVNPGKSAYLQRKSRKVSVNNHLPYIMMPAHLWKSQSGRAFCIFRPTGTLCR